MRIPHYYPQKKGQADRFIDTLKTALRKIKKGEKSMILFKLLCKFTGRIFRGSNTIPAVDAQKHTDNIKSAATE